MKRGSHYKESYEARNYYIRIKLTSVSAVVTDRSKTVTCESRLSDPQRKQMSLSCSKKTQNYEFDKYTC